MTISIDHRIPEAFRSIIENAQGSMQGNTADEAKSIQWSAHDIGNGQVIPKPVVPEATIERLATRYLDFEIEPSDLKAIVDMIASIGTQLVTAVEFEGNVLIQRVLNQGKTSGQPNALSSSDSRAIALAQIIGQAQEAFASAIKQKVGELKAQGYGRSASNPQAGNG
jgi:hypothetical protein